MPLCRLARNRKDNFDSFTRGTTAETDRRNTNSHFFLRTVWGVVSKLIGILIPWGQKGRATKTNDRSLVCYEARGVSQWANRDAEFIVWQSSKITTNKAETEGSRESYRLFSRSPISAVGVSRFHGLKSNIEIRTDRKPGSVCIVLLSRVNRRKFAHREC